MKIAIATKTSLYKLVSDYELLPPSKVVQFCKVPKASSYFLLWHEDGCDCTAYFTAPLGKMTLTISGFSTDGSVGDEVYYPSDKRVAELNLAKEA